MTGCDAAVQGPNAAARQAIQSRNPQLPEPRGRIQLDEEPDVREVSFVSFSCYGVPLPAAYRPTAHVHHLRECMRMHADSVMSTPDLSFSVTVSITTARRRRCC